MRLVESKKGISIGLLVLLVSFTGCTSIHYSIDHSRQENFGLSMITIPNGSFVYGNEANVYTIEGFQISQFEISRDLFFSVMGTDPSAVDVSTGAQDPVQRVSWYHALVFCNVLSIKEGRNPVYIIKNSRNPADWGRLPIRRNRHWDSVQIDWNANGYRLPTEKEWLWAAMGADFYEPGALNREGWKKPFSGAIDQSLKEEYAWVVTNAEGSSRPIGTRLPNELGIFDMSGNVWEWCHDWYSPDSIDNSFAPSGQFRLIRGGDWFFNPQMCRLDYRLFDFPYSRNSTIGFRVVRNTL